MPMCICLPLARKVNSNEAALLGTAFAVARWDDLVAFVTALHVVGDTVDELFLAIPPHAGNLSLPQPYLIQQFPTLSAELVATDPFRDLALIQAKGIQGPIDLGRLHPNPASVRIGESVAVVGYPFAVIGSMLQTYSPGVVSARGVRRFSPNVDLGAMEWILSHHTHPGQSGSPVVSTQTGLIIGVVRGSLAPPETIQIGGVSLGTDTSVTFASDASAIPSLIKVAKERRHE